MSTAVWSVLLPAAVGLMDDVAESVQAFLPPPECPHGCMNWTVALNQSEQAASFADPSILPSLSISFLFICFIIRKIIFVYNNF